MANAQITVKNATDATPAIGGVFGGTSLFLVQRLPMRASYVDKVKANGGRVVKVESQADYIIADHYRLDCPPASLSYTFVDAAIKNGALPNPAEHRAGPAAGTVRAAGSAVPGKSTRTPFTAEDDRVLWQWVERARRDGGLVKGNEIYKQLEAVNNRHTYQAWRDRYIKRLIDKPPEGVQVNVSANAPPSPPTAPDSQEEVRGQVAVSGEARNDGQLGPGFDGTADDDDDTDDAGLPEDDVEALLQHADDIENIAEDQVEDAWNMFAGTFGRHSADEWRKIWLEEARPVYRLQLAEEQAARDKAKRVEAEELARPSSSSSKRKRAPKSPEKTYGRKRQKSAELEISGQQDEEPSRTNGRFTTIPALAATIKDPEKPETTGDATAAAQAQFDSEVFGLSAVDPVRSEQQLPTSVLNKAVEEQIRRESGDYVISSDSRGNIIGHVLQPAQGQEDDGNVDSEALLAQELQPLTAANLASQQAEHATHIRHATDLPPDEDDEADAGRQDQFVSYLQDLNRHSGRLQDAGTSKNDWERLSQGSDADLPDLVSGFMSNALTDNLHMSSHKELDEAMEGIMSWPDSPKQSQKPLPVAEALQFETQIVYPSLPDQTHVQLDATVRHAQRDAPVYPDLSQQSARSPSPSRAQIEDEGENEEQETWSSQPQHDMRQSQKAGGYALSDEVVPLPPSEGSEEEDELEYAVPRAVKPVEPFQPLAKAKASDVISIDSASSASSNALANDETDPARNQSGSIRQQRKLLETQDILDAETQIPDLDIPLPLDSDHESADLPSDPLAWSSSPPPHHPSTRLQSQQNLANTQQLPDDGVNDYIATMIVRGFEEASVISALKAASMRPDLAKFVMLEEKAGRGIPQDVPGIWTEEEDQLLEGGDAKGIRRVSEKHGWDELEARMAFLVQYREIDEDEEDA